MTVRQALPVLAVLLALALGALATFSKVVTVRADLGDFLPPGGTPTTRLLLDELREGRAASLILLGIEGAEPAELARISRSVAAELRRSPLIAFVGNEAASFTAAEQEFLFDRRYLLSPATTPEAFTEEALRQQLGRLLEQLSGSTAPLAKRFGFADPTGAWTALAGIWLGQSRVELKEGVWFAAGADRALLLAVSRASALDAASGRQALDAVEAAFARAEPGSGRLLIAGPGVFAVEAAEAIRRDVHLIATLSTLLVTAFLLWRHRSVYVLAAAAIPLMAGVLVGALAVQLAHGFVHAIALGFGLTMLGVTADYPLLLIGQRGEAEITAAAARRIWPTMALAATTGALGLTAMLLSSFPGLSQLGLFSAAGLLTAALVTRYSLPLLVEDVAFRGQQVTPGWLRAAAWLRSARIGLIALAGAATLYLALGRGPAWEDDLGQLSAVSPAAQSLDEDLRRQLGAPDVRHLIAISGVSSAEVLEKSERLEATIAGLVRQGVVGGTELPSRYLPSPATQQRRQAAMPERDELARRLDAARVGLPFRPEAFAPFLADVADQRARSPVTPAAFTPPVLGARLEPLLFEREARWYGLALLTDVRAPDRVRDAIAAAGDPDLVYLDLKVETERMVASYTREALTWLALGGAMLLAVLAGSLRDAGLVLRVVAPIACALLIVLALLDLLAIRLTLFHLAAMLLMVGVSIDYALFLNQRTNDDADRFARTLGSVLNCSATTLLTFGLLAWCRNPVLQGIGLTVASGVMAAVVFVVGLSRKAA